MKVLFCSSEVAPFAKTGGLADVAGSLPLALGKLGIQTLVMMPKYRGIDGTEKNLSEWVSVRFVEHEGFFNRSGLYGNDDSDYPDNLDRFSFFSHECLKLAKQTDFRPDIVHAHDWHTALVPVLLKTRYAADDFFKKSRSVLTIHNLAYQGRFPAAEYPKTGLPIDLFSVDGFEFYGEVNMLKAGLLYADWLNTVSPTYAAEIRTREYGFGLEGVLQKRKSRLRGILNGIDTELWDPATDPNLQAHYSADSLAGKAECRNALLKKCGFDNDPTTPVLAVVSRLAHQKGLDLLADALPAILEHGVKLVVLGDGDPEYRRLYQAIGHRYSQQVKIFLGFHVKEAHRVYAGADLFLMPSLFEPCGLGQLISMRYGAIPVVRATGGLKDTVIDADRDAARGNGFSFDGEKASDLAQTVERALAAWRDTARRCRILDTAMRADFSWNESARQYETLYREAMA